MKNNVINFQQFKMNQNQDEYEKLISLLSDERPEFRGTTNDVIQSFIDWLKEEAQKSPENRSEDLIFMKWQEAVNEAYSNDIRYLCTKQLVTLIGFITKSRTSMKICAWQYRNTASKDISPQRIKIMSRLEASAERFKETNIDLIKSLETIQDISGPKTVSLTEKFFHWHVENLKKPIMEQAKNRDYNRWKRMLRFTMLCEIDFKYLSGMDRMRLSLVKVKQKLNISKNNNI